MTTLSLMKQPSAFLPVAMSLAALTLVLVHVAMYGLVHESDEGTPAHVFQLLIVAQLPIAIYFGAKWLPRIPGPALQVLVLQGSAACAAIATVVWFRL